MNNQLELIKKLKNKGVLRTKSIISAFSKIDRADFVLEEYKKEAYLDIPLPINYNQTISQPYTVALMLELLSPKKNQAVLDIGCGSAYSSALLAKIVKPNGIVYGLEIIPQLLEYGKRNLKKYPDLNIDLNLAKEKSVGLVNYKFDRILVSAAAKSLPTELLLQLKKGGKLVIPINNSIFLYEKDKNDKINYKEYFGFTFVPLK